MENRKRNTALVLIGAGLYLLFGKIFGFFAVSSLVVIGLGFYGLRFSKRGYLIMLIGAVLLLNSRLSVVASVLLIILGLYYLKYRQTRNRSQNETGNFRESLRFMESIRKVGEPWELKNTGMWSVISEIRLDLSLAMMEGDQTTLILQGVIGDIDLLVPEDLDVSVEGSVFLGQMQVGAEKDTGFMNRINWQSPDYGSGRHRLKLFVSYFVGDIDIKRI